MPAGAATASKPTAEAGHMPDDSGGLCVEGLAASCLCCCRSKKNVVLPGALYCELCLEEGALRPCCGHVFCEHDYSKNRSCPNCKMPTLKEQAGSVTTLAQGFTEQEECRVCLELGIRRRCCGQYYCDKCYYNQRTCRSCGADVTSSGLNYQLKSKASFFSVLAGWMASIFIALLILGGAAVIVTNELTMPVGIYGNKCSSFFARCDTKVCIDISPSVSNYPYDSLGLLSDWRYCTLDSTEKLEASACIYDDQMYEASGQGLGFEVCESLFRNGVYVLEDDFDTWVDFTQFSSSVMKSAKWQQSQNAFAKDDCSSVSGQNALVFNGPSFRFIDTQDLDVAFGGFVAADVLLASDKMELAHPLCKAAYIGDIAVYYSIDQGASWVMMQTYSPALLRGTNFFHIEIELPPQAQTNMTRFRFNQPVFETMGDSWALDNVKVFHYFAPGWKDDPDFTSDKSTSAVLTQQAQCCFDTEHCEQRLSNGETKYCDTNPFFDKQEFRLRQSEAFICFVLFFNILKFVYNSIQDWIVRKRVPFQEEYDLLLKNETLMSYIPAKYRPKKKKDSADSIAEIHRFARESLEARSEAVSSGIADVESHMLKVEEDRKRLQKLIDKQNGKGKKKKRKSDVRESEEARDGAESDGMSTSEIDEETLTRPSVPQRKVVGIRMPFEIEQDRFMRTAFAVGTIGVLVVLFFFKSGTQADYTIVENFNAYGVLDSNVTLLSGGILLFALFCDAKEIYHTLKFVVPLFDSFIPLVTIDSSSEANALYINNYTIGLSDILEAHVFGEEFIRYCVAGYAAGCFPWSIVLLILRDFDLPYDANRMIVPTLGAFLVLRATLGPSIFVKAAFAMRYWLDSDVKVREAVGVAIKADRTYYTAINAAAMISLGGTFFVSIFAASMAGIAFGGLLLFGYFYGALTGCVHGLPIHPWMSLTTIRDGVWLRLKKKERCPCVYWGRYCTDMHSVQELFVIFPKDHVLFMSRLKGMND